MNQSTRSDSENSLDAESRLGDSFPMIAQPYQLYVERTDASKNMARFYAMAIEPTLFGDVCLTRRWGRIGAPGQVMRHSFLREEDAVGLFLALLRRKRNRGYHPKGRALARQPPGSKEGEAGSMSRPAIVGVVFVDDVEGIAVVDLVAGKDAVFAVDLEERDRDHKGTGELEGVVLGKGKIVRHF